MAAPLCVAVHAACAADTMAAGTTKIRVILVEAHDRLTPTPLRGIIKRHEVDVFLKPGGQIEEVAREFDATSSSGRTYNDANSDRAAALGGRGKVVWHVLGPSQLQRLAQNPSGQLLQVWTIVTDANRGCHVDAKYLLQEGQGETRGRIAGFGTPATFTNFKVLQATCTIE